MPLATPATVTPANRTTSTSARSERTTALLTRLARTRRQASIAPAQVAGPEMESLATLRCRLAAITILVQMARLARIRQTDLSACAGED